MFMITCLLSYLSDYFVKPYSSEATDVVLVLDGSSNLMNSDSERVKEAAKTVISTLNSEDRVGKTMPMLISLAMFHVCLNFYYVKKLNSKYGSNNYTNKRLCI